jgi:hypothetical protein
VTKAPGTGRFSLRALVRSHRGLGHMESDVQGVRRFMKFEEVDAFKFVRLFLDGLKQATGLKWSQA